MSATNLLRTSLGTNMREGVTFPVAGFTYRDREEVTSWAKIHQCLRGQPGMKLVKKEGRPYQNWNCTGVGCNGRMKINFVEGQKTPGVVVESHMCTCPLRKNTPEESNGHIFCNSADKVRTALVRFFHWDCNVQLLDYRATPPSGFQGNSNIHDVLFRNDHPSLEETVPPGKRRKIAAKQKNFYGLVHGDKWFHVPIQQVKATDDGSEMWTPKFIPSPHQAATKCKPMPIPDPSDIVEIDSATAVSEQSTASDVLCMTCHTSPAINKLCCPTEGCQGGLLCCPCTMRYACTRPSPLNDNLDPTWYQFVDQPGVKCLYRCDTLVSHFVAIEDDVATLLPLPLPAFFLYHRPARSLREAFRMKFGFEYIFAPIYSANLQLASDIETSEHRLEFLREELADCNSQSVEAILKRDIAVEEIKLKVARQQKAKVRYPDWSMDWTNSKPYPVLSDLDVPGGPSPTNIANYMANFDLGNNPLAAGPTFSVRSLAQQGPLSDFLQETFNHYHVFGADYEINVRMKDLHIEGDEGTDTTGIVDLTGGNLDVTASESADTLDGDDSDYVPNGDDEMTVG